jgi:hypothetical protein
MATNQGRRGVLPEIRTDPDAITFVLTIAGRQGQAPKLVLRCERDGELLASILPGGRPDAANG